MAKHSLYFLAPFDTAVGKQVAELNCTLMDKKSHVFDGHRLAAVAVGPGMVRPADGSVRWLPDGHLWTAVHHDPELREVVGWLELWAALERKHPANDDWVYWSHAKGVSKTDAGTATYMMGWAEMMHWANLDRPETQKFFSSKKAIGAFVKTHRSWPQVESSHHFHGGCFWIRWGDAKDKWRDIAKFPFGTEAWPGQHFLLSECGHSFGTLEPHQDLYSIELLTQRWDEYKRCKSSPA